MWAELKMMFSISPRKGAALFCHIYCHKQQHSCSKCYTLVGLFQIGLVPGVCEADCVGHSGVLSDHPDWRLCQSCYCSFLKLLLVLGPGGWICKSDGFQINQMFNVQATELK